MVDGLTLALSWYFHPPTFPALKTTLRKLLAENRGHMQMKSIKNTQVPDMVKILFYLVRNLSLSTLSYQRMMRVFTNWELYVLGTSKIQC